MPRIEIDSSKDCDREATLKEYREATLKEYREATLKEYRITSSQVKAG